MRSVLYSEGRGNKVHAYMRLSFGREGVTVQAIAAVVSSSGIRRAYLLEGTAGGSHRR
ncbi:hypothetical protein BDW22DRAFT_1358203 [Trametopsis cervina]|nr:hypothetical protein BDW22DRAFT_1358203 [Trametopsis cervina]